MALQGDVEAAVGLERACVSATMLEWHAAVGAERRLGGGRVLPLGCGTVECEVFEHTSAHPIEAGIEFGLDLAQRGFGVLEAPLTHAGHDLLCQLMPEGLIELPTHRPPPFAQSAAGVYPTTTDAGCQPARTWGTPRAPGGMYETTERHYTSPDRVPAGESASSAFLAFSETWVAREG